MCIYIYSIDNLSKFDIRLVSLGFVRPVTSNLSRLCIATRVCFLMFPYDYSIGAFCYCFCY